MISLQQQQQQQQREKESTNYVGVLLYLLCADTQRMIASIKWKNEWNRKVGKKTNKNKNSCKQTNKWKIKYIFV